MFDEAGKVKLKNLNINWILTLTERHTKQ